MFRGFLFVVVFFWFEFFCFSKLSSVYNFFKKNYHYFYYYYNVEVNPHVKFSVFVFALVFLCFCLPGAAS